eukprot:1313523-Pleurochrysis_carterae.AAC.1
MQLALRFNSPAVDYRDRSVVPESFLLRVHNSKQVRRDFVNPYADLWRDQLSSRARLPLKCEIN